MGWFYCPKCASAFDRPYSANGGCYCTPVEDEHGEIDTWLPTAVVPLPDQDAAEAAFVIGGIEAVWAIAKQVKENACPSPP